MNELIELEYYRQLKYSVLIRCYQIFKNFDLSEFWFNDQVGYWQVSNIRIGRTLEHCLNQLGDL